MHLVFPRKIFRRIWPVSYTHLSLSREQFRLYQLIWKRFTASRMASAVYETTSVKIDANGYRFTVAASKVKFDGFMSVYTQEEDEKAEGNKMQMCIRDRFSMYTKR